MSEFICIVVAKLLAHLISVVFVVLAITIPIKQTIAGTTCDGRNLLNIESKFEASWK